MTALATVASSSRQVQRKRAWADHLDGATAVLHRFDERGGGVNFIELRVADEAVLHVKRSRGAR